MLAHHALSILGLLVTLCIGRYGTEMMACMFGTEITNPLLQLRWFLREDGRHKTRLGLVNDIVFVALFGAMRIGLGSYLLYTYFCHPRPDWLGKFGGCTLYMIGWMFWVQICAYAWKKLLRPTAASTRSRTGGDGPLRDVLREDSAVANGHGPVPSERLDHVNNIVNGKAEPIRAKSE